jgi:hypothetical protein
VQYRAVDCDTRQPLAFSSAANKTYGGVLGGATPVVYNGNFVRGWGYNSWKLNWANLTLPAPGLGSTSPGPGVRNATCQQISGAGGLIGFYCIKCRDVFTDAVQLSIRDAKQLSGDPTGGAVPPLRVVVSQRFYNATGGAGACVFMLDACGAAVGLVGLALNFCSVRTLVWCCVYVRR